MTSISPILQHAKTISHIVSNKATKKQSEKEIYLINLILWRRILPVTRGWLVIW